MYSPMRVTHLHRNRLCYHRSDSFVCHWSTLAAPGKCHQLGKWASFWIAHFVYSISHYFIRFRSFWSFFLLDFHKSSMFLENLLHKKSATTLFRENNRFDEMQWIQKKQWTKEEERKKNTNHHQPNEEK